MEILKILQEVLFQKMLQLQRGNMQSRLAFVLLLICKYIFKDVILLLMFLVPIPILNGIPDQVFSALAQLSMSLTLIILVFLLLFLSIYIFSSHILDGKILLAVQIVMPWLDALSLSIVIITINLIFVNISNNIALVICNIISLIVVTAIQVVYNIFYFTKSPRTKNFYDRRQARTVIISSLLTLCLCLYLSIQASSSGLPFGDSELIICSAIHLFLTAIKLKQRIYMKYYLNPLSQIISTAFYFLELNLAILAAVGNIFVSQDFIFNNIIPILLIMTLLGYSSLVAFISRRNSDMVLSSAGELKNQDQAMLYLDCLCTLVTKVQNEQEDIILISLKKKHLLKCRNANCYCQGSKQLKPFVEQYVKGELVEMNEIFHNSPNILISILYFKLVMFHYYPQILARLNYFSGHFNLSLIQRYHKYCLGQEIRRFIHKRNYEISAIQSEHMFKLEEIRLEIENIIKGEIEVRSKKWKYISRGLCRVSQLEHNCNRQLKYINRIMTIYNQNKIRFKKSKEFNLLLLFYFIKVSFLNNGKEIRANLKQIYYGYREDELFDLKEFKKFIYHKRSCVIETLVDNKSMGIITAASHNIEEMFGFSSSKVIGVSINNLMPEFMADQHQFIMSDWAKSGTWRTIGKLKQIYCIHKEQYCFSALLYLKIYLKENNMHFITNVFKLNDSDYLILNPTMKIQGLGRKFLKLLGEPAKRMNVDVLIQKPKNSECMFSNLSFVEEKTYGKVFMSLRNMQIEVDHYLQALNMKLHEQERELVKQQFHMKLKERCEEKYFIEFNVKKYQMGRIWFLVITMEEAKKIEKYQTETFINSPPTYLRMEVSHNHIEEIEQDKNSEDQDDGSQQLIIDHNANSSMTSITQKENYPLAKTIEKFTVLLQQPSNIRDERLIKFNCIIIFMLIFLSIIDFISFLGYRATLFEIKDIFYANGAVSDIMQTTEIAYNQLYVLQAQLRNGTQTDFNSTLKSLNLIQNYVYSLKQYSFSHLLSDVTSLTQQRFYSYIYHPAEWKINSRNVQIQTYQFLQQFYYLTSKAISELKTAEKSHTSFSNSSLLILFENFPEMQSLNDYFLSNYQQNSNFSHNTLNYLSIISLLVYLLVSMTLAYMINHYFKFRFIQVIDSFNFFSHIPSQYLQKMKEYYAMLMTNVVEGDKLKNIDNKEDQIFSIDTYDLFHKNDNAKAGHNNKIKLINYENYYKWIYIFIILCLVNGINYIATLQIRDFFAPSQDVVTLIAGLVRAQNKVLECYFDLKSAYYLQPTQDLNQTLYDTLASSMNQSEIQWNAVADELTTIFNSYDPNYEQNLVNVLVTNICNLTAPELTPFQNDKCVNNISLNILDGGILVAMNFFQRSVRNAMQDLKMQYVTHTKLTYAGDYFQQLDFVQLDKMLFYMFKIFQLTQGVAFTSYDNAIYLITNNYLQITLGITAFFVIVLLLWIKTIPQQKEQLSLLYGHLLLVPFMILRANNRIASNLKEAIEYSDS